MTNKYSISKHRFYELKHWCLQYPEWLQLYSELDGFSDDRSDTTSKNGILRADILSRIDCIKTACKETDVDIWEDLFRTVTKGERRIPPSSDLYKRFFWILDRSRK